MTNKYPNDLSQLSRTVLQSELNALRFYDKLDAEDIEYFDRLVAEINNRILAEFQNDTEGT